MSSPACVEGYYTPAQQREDSTTFMDSRHYDKKVQRLLDLGIRFSSLSSAPQYLWNAEDDNAQVIIQNFHFDTGRQNNASSHN